MSSIWQKGLMIIVVIIILSITFTGCITPLPENTTLQKTSPPTSQVTIYATPPLTPLTSSINTLKPQIITGTQFPEPIFTFSTRSTVDTDGRIILSEYQAWTYAEAYLQMNKSIINIIPEEVTARGPKVVTDKGANPAMIWTFEIHRKDKTGFERGGILAVDAYDGHIVWYAAFT